MIHVLKWVFLVAICPAALTPAWSQSHVAVDEAVIESPQTVVPSVDLGRAEGDDSVRVAESKYWIFFVDRDANDTISRFAATPEALTRRARRGTAASASVDQHVSPAYIEALEKLGVRPVVESRWMNAVSAVLSEAQRRAVAALDAVARIQPVRRYEQARTVERDTPITVPLRALAGPLATVHQAAVYRATVSSTADVGAAPAYAHSEEAGSAPKDATSAAALDRALVATQVQSRLDYGASEEQLALVNAIPPLEAGINGSGVRLGFLDASFRDFDHPSLDHLHLDNRIQFMDFAGAQGGSHGLSVVSVAAGLAPGELIGPAHGAHILGATTEYVPSETNAEEDYFVAGLEWLEAMGADVVNASIGYTTFDPGERSYTPDDLDGNTGVTTRAADRAVSLGIVFVAAAGNEGCHSPESCWYYVGTPADGDSVIAVGGVTRAGTRSSFSSFGPTADGRTKPDVAAQGSSVYIAIPADTFAYSGGTSFAAPMVAGIVAQMLQANPLLQPMEVADILRQTASQADRPDNALGWGIVNAGAAVQIAADIGSEQLPAGELLVTHAYPNPATDYLFIHIKARSVYRPDIHMYDVLGRTIDMSSADVRYPGGDHMSLSTEHLPQGVYFYVIELPDMRASGRFVIVR